MKIGLFADLHLRGEDILRTEAQLDAATRVLLERGVQVIAVAGDVFHKMNLSDSHASTGAVARLALQWIAQLDAYDVQVILIPGNHDYSGPGRADALHVLEPFPNVIVVRNPIRIGSTITGMITLDCEILAVPWLYSDESFDSVVRRAMEALDQPPVDLLLAHVQVQGALQNRKHAMDFHERTACEPRPGDWSTTREFLSSLPIQHFALGDFHMRQDVTGGRGGYIGALRQLDFGEEGNPQGFEIWDSETDTTEWVELSECPKHKTITAKPGSMIGMEPLDGYKCRVRYEGMPDPLEARELESRGVQVEAIVERRERVKRCDVPTGMVGDLPATLRFWASQQTDEVDVGRALAALRLIDSDDVQPMDEPALDVKREGESAAESEVLGAELFSNQPEPAPAATGTDDEIPF